MSCHEDHLVHVLLPSLGLGLRDHGLGLQLVLRATLPPGEPVGVGPQWDDPLEVPLTKPGWVHHAVMIRLHNNISEQVNICICICICKLSWAPLFHQESQYGSVLKGIIPLRFLLPSLGGYFMQLGSDCIIIFWLRHRHFVYLPLQKLYVLIFCCLMMSSFLLQNTHICFSMLPFLSVFFLGLLAIKYQ